ncbi:MAG: hypothetical protein C5S48_01960 [Candidatus Methanogaster sp.]|nr:MAG: hypothetical protein C5S48_01960 [ANME-2 cluster archaeon]
MVRNIDQTDVRIDDGDCVEGTLPPDDEKSDVLKVYLAVRKPVDGALFLSRGGVRLNNNEIGRIVKEYVRK